MSTLWQLQVFFERTAGILFWHKPSEWLVGSSVLEGNHGNGRRAASLKRARGLLECGVLRVLVKLGLVSH